MTKITNSGKRRLGLAGRPSLVLNPGESVEVSPAQYQSVTGNRTNARWIASGVLTVDNEPGGASEPEQSVKDPNLVNKSKEETVELPEGVTGSGVERHHVGGGWWDVYVNGFKVTDDKVKKDASITIAAEYE